MLTSVMFLIVFGVALATGLDVDWTNFLWGTAFGVSLARIAMRLMGR